MSSGDETEAADRSPAWRIAGVDDLDVIMTIQDEVHTLLPERREVFADKMRLFGEGCLVLGLAGRVRGYGVAHPWRVDDVPPLDRPLGALPEAADCLFIHDVAILPEGRAQGAGGAFVRRMSALARERNLGALALVSVYGTTSVWERCGFAVLPGRIPPEKFAGYGPTARYMTASVAPHSNCGPGRPFLNG